MGISTNFVPVSGLSLRFEVQVQLLYSDPSLGSSVEFLIKRLEILQTDPANLSRSYNIDRYLASFCKVTGPPQEHVPKWRKGQNVSCVSPPDCGVQWQEEENSPLDSDPLHWDHAVILTGLDVHVVDRDKKISAQV